MKLWSDPRINSRILAPIRSFEAQKSEAELRTCVYSRYASMKTHAFKRFYRSQVTSGLAVDYRYSYQDNGFSEVRALRHLDCAANKNHHFLNLEN